MPKISAASVAEHVAHQHSAVVDAAIALFGERGVNAVTLGDIADVVGLKRTSLYRYFPSKWHLVLAWFESTMASIIDTSNDIAASSAPRRVRLQRWIDVQFDLLTDPGHAPLIAAALDTDEMPAELRDRIGCRHRDLYASLSAIIDRPAGTLRVRTMLIAGLIRSSAELVRAGAEPAQVRAELSRASAAVAGR